MGSDCPTVCKICEAPCVNGEINHGKGCYHLSEDGGGTESCNEDHAQPKFLPEIPTFIDPKAKREEELLGTLRKLAYAEASAEMEVACALLKMMRDGNEGATEMLRKRVMAAVKEVTIRLEGPHHALLAVPGNWTHRAQQLQRKRILLR